MLWQCLLFPWSTEGEQAKTEEEFPFSYGSCTHTVLLWLPNVEWIILIDFASLLCLYTVNSLLLQCVSSDIELKFRCGVLQFGSLSFIQWNPSTLHFHEKTKQDNNNNNNNNKNLSEGWSSQLYTQLLQLGEESLKQKPACTGFKPFDLCDTGAALYQLNCTGIAEVKGSNPVQAGFFFSGFLFASAKVAYITAMIILHLICHSAVRIIWFSYIQNFIKKTLIHFITSTNIQQLLDEVEQNRDILR